MRDRDSTVVVDRWLNTPLRTDDFGGVLGDRITSGNGSRPRIPQRWWNNCLTRRSNTERSLTTEGLLESLIDGRRRGSGGFQHSLKRFSSRDSTWKWIKFLNVVVSLKREFPVYTLTMYVIISAIGMTSLKRKKHEGISES